MTELVSVLVGIATFVYNKLNQMGTNNAACVMLKRKVYTTKQVLENLQALKSSNPGATQVLRIMKDALEETKEVTEEFCNASSYKRGFRSAYYSEQLTSASSLLDHALQEISLVSAGMITEVQTSMVTTPLLDRAANRIVEAVGKVVGEAVGQGVTKLLAKIEEGFARQRTDQEAITRLIQDLAKEQDQMRHDYKAEFASLRRELKEARERKDQRTEHTLTKAIDAILHDPKLKKLYMAN